VQFADRPVAPQILFDGRSTAIRATASRIARLCAGRCRTPVPKPNDRDLYQDLRAPKKSALFQARTKHVLVFSHTRTESQPRVRDRVNRDRAMKISRGVVVAMESTGARPRSSVTSEWGERLRNLRGGPIQDEMSWKNQRTGVDVAVPRSLPSVQVWIRVCSGFHLLVGNAAGLDDNQVSRRKCRCVAEV